MSDKRDPREALLALGSVGRAERAVREAVEDGEGWYGDDDSASVALKGYDVSIGDVRQLLHDYARTRDALASVLLEWEALRLIPAPYVSGSEVHSKMREALHAFDETTRGASR